MNIKHHWIRNLLGIVVAVCLFTIGQSNSSQAQPRKDFFSIVVLPDTQNYTDSSFGGSPNHFTDQTTWIKNNREKLNIVMVAHVGDIVNHPTATVEWNIASDAFKILDSHVPYCLCVGNHDIANDHTTDPGLRKTLLNEYFPPSRFIENPLYAPNFWTNRDMHFLEPGKSDNYYLYFTGAGLDFLILSLEFKPRDQVLTWANHVVASHPDRRCIVLTHGYLNADGSLYNGNYALQGNEAPEIWDKFVSRHENIFLVLCGHVLGEAYSARIGLEGNKVHQILTDYQNDYIGDGGQGYLRIMTFYPKQKKIENLSYSPTLNVYLTRPQSQFILEFD